MKRYNNRNYIAFKKDLKVLREDDLKNYYEYVIQIANTFPRDSIAIGILDITDLIQAGNVGLVEAWNRVDWDLINESPNPNGQLWSFLKKRIRFAIRQEIDKHGAFIKVPERVLRDHKKNLTGIDKILVNTFPKFWDHETVFQEDYSDWNNEQLGLLLDDIIYDNIKSHNHQQILKLSFGVDTLDNKSVSIKKIAKMYNLSEIGVKKIKQRSIDKIKENEETKIIIENFFQR